MLDLRILNGMVVREDGVEALDVGVEAGRIAELAPAGALGPAREEIDASGLHVLPGAIDVHFHCRAPSHPERGTFASETAAAAAGGVTTVFEMPISDPACSSPEVLRRRRLLAGQESYVNVALYSGAAVGGRARAEEMARAGAIAFKLFTLAPAPGRAAEFEGLWANSEPAILRALEGAAGAGLVCVVHAENEALARHFRPRPRANGILSPPPVVEAVSIAMVGALAREAGAAVHFAHVSSAISLDAVRGAAVMGAGVTAETCPQYLALDSTAIERHAGLAKIAPPLREASGANALWAALRDGSLDMVASDHSPFLPEEKVGVEYVEAPPGLPTVELLLPVLLDGAARGHLPLERAAALVSAAPARRFGLYPGKGCIAPGADADLALVSLTDRFRPGPDALLSLARGCGAVFGGLDLQGRVRMTLVDGRVVFAGGAVRGAPRGRFVPGPASSMLEPA